MTPDKKMQKLKKLSSDPNLMASAEEFADLIEQYQDDDVSVQGTFDDVANTNRSSAKQLKWEKKRHHDMAAAGSKRSGGGSRKKFQGGSRGRKTFKKK